ncbi:hypothetical protein ABPG74_013065 [Tetrahymena malaccensis]
MDQQNIDFSDIEQFLLTHYRKCPNHKRLITYLRLDNKEDPLVFKCLKCLDEKKFKIFVDIVELLQSDDHFLFQKWPIHDDDTISENLEKIKQWPFAQYCEEINFIFDEMVEKIQLKRKEILKDLGQIQEDQQKSLNYYKQISQKEELKNIIKSQFGDQKKQNEMILNIIKENEQNNESNKKQLVDLINEANKNIFDLTKVKNMKDEVLSLINMLKTFDNQQGNQIIEQPDNMSVNNNDQNFEEITINQFDDLDKCYDFKKINIDFSETGIEDVAIKNIAKGLAKHQNITSLELFLGENNIGNEGINYLAKKLKKFLNLETLDISFGDNNIGIQGCELIINEIEKKNKKINQLSINLKNNNIDDVNKEQIRKKLDMLIKQTNIEWEYEI